MKTNKRLVCLFMAACMTLMMMSAPVYAKGLGYTNEMDDRSETFSKDGYSIYCNFYFNRIVLKGDTDAIKKINKALKKESDNFLKVSGGSFENAQWTLEECPCNDTYYECMDQSVRYNDGKIISITGAYQWYSGGVSNPSITGYTFSVKTGNRIRKITSVTKETSLKKIKATLLKKIMASDENLSEEEVKLVLDSKSASDFNFYISKKGNVVVCFYPYELGYGGWYRTFVLKGKYSK